MFSGSGAAGENQLVLTDVVYGSGAELAVELLGPQAPEVVDGIGPEVQHVVAGERVSLLDHHHLGSEQSQLDGRPQATRAPTDDQALWRGKEHTTIVMESCPDTPI